MSSIIGQSERACFIVCNQYPNGHQYWHGFADKKSAVEFSAPFRGLDVTGQLFFGVINISAKQVQESHGPRGCTLEPVQISSNIKEVK